jgi:hypothetical protein
MPRVQPPSLLHFHSRYLQPLLPVVFEALADHWPATTRWRDLAYLDLAAGTRTVPVELGDHYLAHNWRQKLMPVSQFIKEHMAPAAASSSGSGSPAAAAQAKAMGYVAQHDLFSQVKRLRADIIVPDYVCTTEHSDAQAAVCPAAAAAFLADLSADSPHRAYHCCCPCPCPCPAAPQHHVTAAAASAHLPPPPPPPPPLISDSPPPPPPPLPTSTPPPSAGGKKKPRECVSPTPPDADGGGDGGDCAVRMHAWFGPAGATRNPKL